MLAVGRLGSPQRVLVRVPADTRALLIGRGADGRRSGSRRGAAGGAGGPAAHRGRAGGALAAHDQTSRQIVAVTAMNLRALPLRMTTSLVSVIGIAGVVLILVALLSISEGFRRTLELSGSDRVAVVLRGSSGAELTSSFSQDQVQIIEQAPGIARDATGQSSPQSSTQPWISPRDPPGRRPMRHSGNRGTGAADPRTFPTDRRPHVRAGT